MDGEVLGRKAMMHTVPVHVLLFFPSHDATFITDSLVCIATTGDCAACAMVISVSFLSSSGASARLVLLPLRPSPWIRSPGSHVRSVASRTNGSIEASGKVRMEV